MTRLQNLALGLASAILAHSPWLDASLDAAERARLATGAMTLAEKLSLLQGDTTLDANGSGVNACVGHLPAIERLSLPALCFGDGPAGVGNGLTQVTQFPAPIAGAATWDVALMTEYGSALGEEQRGKGRNVVLAPTLNILRTPKWGRAAESLGEDPWLTARLGVALVQGIQSAHVIATPKHFVANNQETLRLGDAPAYDAIDVQVDERALREIYYPAFRAAVTEAHAGAVMCSYNQVNGVYACENPALDGVLRREWHFDGFVVSDWYFAHRSTLPAALAGLDVSMPGGRSDFGFAEFYGAPLRDAIVEGRLASSRLDSMVENVLRPVFRLGLDIAPPGPPAASVRSAEHQALALKIAAQGAVLLKNTGILPLEKPLRTLAVIGDDASAHVQTTERYGGFVNDPHLPIRAPLAAISERAQGLMQVKYSAGTLGTAGLTPVPASVLSPQRGRGAGLTASWYGTADLSGSPVRTTLESSIDVHEAPAGLPPVWSVRWQGTLLPPSSGLYRFSLSGGGDATLYVNGREVARIAKQGFTAVAHGIITLVGGHAVPVRMDYAVAATISKPALQWGWQPADDLITRAVSAARSADAAVVFASDNVSEGGDRTQLNLPGDQDALIAAVAAANPRTIVVLHTVGPVLMPWLSHVRAVIEAWYPGEEAADAIAAVLFGDINPSGKLPMTFPASAAQGPDTRADRFPGVRGRVHYAESLRVGYRYYDAAKQVPLFPFGFGLSYTSFRVKDVHVARTSDAEVVVEGIIANTGTRAGAEVLQLYVGFPRGALEPPWQLKGFERIDLKAGERRAFRMVLDRKALAIWDGASRDWVVPSGKFQIRLGNSSRDTLHRAVVEL